MKEKNTYSFRKFMNDIHLWLGIASGIVIFLVCLSGTFLAFEHEIKDVFAKELKVTPTDRKLSVGELVKGLSEKEKGTISRLVIPVAENEPYTVYVKTNPKDRRGTAVQVDPYTGEHLKREKTWADGFMMSMFRLHRWLLLDINVGRPIVGVATIIFVVLCLSGLVLWFPKKWKWKTFKHGFKVKTDANWKRINHDLHNTFGFYSFILLVIMGLTGLCWSFEGYREGASKVLGAPIFSRGGAQPELSQREGEPVKSVDDILGIAAAEFGKKGIVTLSFPSPRLEAYVVSNASGLSNYTPDRLTVDTYGHVVDKEVFADKPLNVKIASLIRPIHTGEVFGMYSKILYFLACLVATSLPVTGTIIWINKLKKKRKRKKQGVSLAIS